MLLPPPLLLLLGLLLCCFCGCCLPLYPHPACSATTARLAPYMLTRTLGVRMPFGTLPSQVPLPGGGPEEFLARHAVMDLGVNNVDDSLAAVTAGGEVVMLSMVELQVGC